MYRSKNSDDQLPVMAGSTILTTTTERAPADPSFAQEALPAQKGGDSQADAF